MKDIERRLFKQKYDIYYKSTRKVYFQQRLLKNPTPYEIKLWDKIKNRQLGVTFVRQKIIVGYIVDFYSQKYRLAIEVDGSYHDGEQDRKRDLILNSVGIYVLRFDNSDIDEDIDRVLSKIRAQVEIAKRLYYSRIQKKDRREKPNKQIRHIETGELKG